MSYELTKLKEVVVPNQKKILEQTNNNSVILNDLQSKFEKMQDIMMSIA